MSPEVKVSFSLHVQFRVVSSWGQPLFQNYFKEAFASLAVLKYLTPSTVQLLTNDLNPYRVALVVEYTSTLLANVGNALVGVLLVCVDSSFLTVAPKNMCLRKKGGGGGSQKITSPLEKRGRGVSILYAVPVGIVPCKCS